MSRKQDLAAELRQISLTPEKKEELEEALKLLETQIKEVEETSENDLFYNREEDFDWMRISAQTVSSRISLAFHRKSDKLFFQFSNHITPKACELMWKNLLHPTINKSSWSKEEDRLLRALAEACGGRRWDTIAEELNTGRTGFQCFVRFQQKHNQALSKRKWSEEEDERLKQLVVKCKVNNFIPWTKVGGGNSKN